MYRVRRARRTVKDHLQQTPGEADMQLQGFRGLSIRMSLSSEVGDMKISQSSLFPWPFARVSL